MSQPTPVREQRPSRFAQFANLSWVQKRVLMAAWLWLPVFWICLRTAGLNRFESWLQHKPIVTRQSSPVSHDEIQSVAEAVNIAANHTPFHATCLSRSLLLCWLLRRRGVASEVRIGVNLASGTLRAHAWVDCAGRPVNDRSDIADEFKPFDSPSAMAAFIAL